jgi:peptide/nickel transport system substrate-binding protein
MQGGAALVGLGLAGCTASPATPAAESPKPATAVAAPGSSPGAAVTSTPVARAKYGGVVRVYSAAGRPPYDYHQLPGAQSSLGANLAYSGLLRLRTGKDIKPPDYTPTGDLAESWEQPDDLTYIFKLRRGVKFHNIAPVNGREATSADVLYSYQRILDLKLLAPLLAGVQKMETPDPYTFNISLAEPNADFLGNLAANHMVIAAREAVEVNGDLKNGPNIGTGPWIFDSVSPSGDFTAVVRNPDYFLKGLPYLDRIEVHRLVDASAILAAFRGKQLDVLASGLDAATVEPIRKASPNEVGGVDIPLYRASDELGFKVDRPPFNDPRVRKAVVLAMDREALIAGASGGYAIPTGGVVTPEVSWQLPPETLKPLYKRDLAGAKQLLAQAGQPNLEFELIVPNYRSQIYVTMGEQLLAQLKEASINATLKVVDTAAYSSVVQQRGEFAAYLGNAGNRLTANFDLLSRYHSKGAVAKIQTGYNNPKLDALIDQQKVLSRDPAKRRALLEEIQRTVIEDNVLVSVSAGVTPLLWWNYLKDLYFNALGSEVNWPWTEAWMDK